ncbi:MAG TPA: cation diffusion facilitator family transporter [Pirellulaceae bacterium]|nr:cation diffusion facilitator family transporter [Pirellulaceae bacterium]
MSGTGEKAPAAEALVNARATANVDAAPHYREATFAAAIGLIANLLLGIVKLVAGIVGSSFALISDAVNSLGDTLASVVAIVALRYAQTPPDEEHPYGHTRVEAVAASNIAVIIIGSALLIAWEAIARFGARHDVPPVWTLAVAGGNVVLKEALYRYKVYVGRRTGSAAIVANAWDHRSDAFCSLAVLVGLIVVRWGGDAWIWADEAAALVVVVGILWSASRVFLSSVHELLDPQAEPGFVDRVRRSAAAVPGVRAVEKLYVRKTGLEYLADIHVQVDAKLTVAEGHTIGHHVKDRLVAEFDVLRDVLVHLEPYPHRHTADADRE